MYTSSLLKVKHGFFTRKGGVSNGLFSSLNFALTKGDERANIIENRKIALSQLGLSNKRLLTLNQIHGSKVVHTENGWDFDNGNTPDADAIITSNPDFVIGILTADCVPILLFDEATNTIAAIHAGWKGACAGIISSTIDELKVLGVATNRLRCAIGPCIAQKNYEVGEEVYEQFINKDDSFALFFRKSDKKNHFFVDLTGIIKQQLNILDITEIDILGIDTYNEEEDFFSCRRAYHRNESTFGCTLSAISLELSL